MKPDIYLASSSPRRQELLTQIGVRYQRVANEVDEVWEPGESPEVFVIRVALEKARAGWRALGEREPHPVLGADTVVVVNGEMLGKPRDRADGLKMLQRLSGTTHQVLTGVALVDDREGTRMSVNNVTFRELTPEECERYWDTGEPADKAGAYAIQGLGAVFVEHMEGSYSGVMGLPLFETADLLDEFQVDYRHAWRRP